MAWQAHSDAERSELWKAPALGLLKPVPALAPAEKRVGKALGAVGGVAAGLYWTGVDVRAPYAALLPSK